MPQREFLPQAMSLSCTGGRGLAELAYYLEFPLSSPSDQENRSISTGFTELSNLAATLPSPSHVAERRAPARYLKLDAQK
jgi:hypothetical protein